MTGTENPMQERQPWFETRAIFLVTLLVTQLAAPQLALGLGSGEPERDSRTPIAECSHWEGKEIDVSSRGEEIGAGEVWEIQAVEGTVREKLRSSCEGVCGDQGSPFGNCWCDPSCVDHGDCCTDYSEQCGPDVRVGVVVNDADYTVSDAEIADVIALASDMLVERAGVTMSLQDVEHFECGDDCPYGMGHFKNAYIDNHADDPPHYMVVLAATYQTLLYGGMGGYSSAVPTGTCNNFVSPIEELGSSHIYAGYVAWEHRYGSCGYDMEGYRANGTWVRVSDVSEGSSCRGIEGIPCDYNPTMGYYMCTDIDWDEHPYLQHSKGYQAKVIVHELLHNFGLNGNSDHFGTATCDAIMGSTDYEDLEGEHTSALYFAMCPYVFDNLGESYTDYCAGGS